MCAHINIFFSLTIFGVFRRTSLGEIEVSIPSEFVRRINKQRSRDFVTMIGGIGYS